MEERDGGSGMTYIGGLGNVAKVLLLLLNMTFMVAGCLLVYFSHRVETSGWLEVFQGDYAWIGSSTLIFMLILGAVVIALAALGCFGALLQQKLLLTIYAIVLLLTAILFVVVAVGAYMANSKADDWGSKNFPATDNEASIGTNFNELYCYAQIPYYCEDASVNTVLTMFNISLSGYFTDSTTNFTSVCDTVTLDAINATCAVCDLISEYSKYTVVLDWIESSCPRSSTNQIWCGGFLLNATGANDMSSSAPFMECRNVFYDLVERWTNVVMVASFVCIIAAVMVLAMTVLLWRNVRGAKHKTMGPSPAPLYQYVDHTPGLSQRSEAMTSQNFSMRSNVPYNPNAARRGYNSPY
ncbi:hypothetical protein F443_17554 [Plasmopara halstedii]|uniref:Tetraspanin/Peripherin n=1 Tax=Plasmopara halstedii TaxID=4781 RepID=A0A0P1AS92_PLAHL|nr:hypothetical protein F443_17554 [Plasmopara halstedii]CEG44746.1 hypothetical protein F443_17554 [Plasmopara halstedii]|eukprot:XP_024581115.1 hypothetical protein F443_17554 [Plasmopara halstedii]